MYKLQVIYLSPRNEPEGFRKITFYPDRPDVLAEFTLPVLKQIKNIQYCLLQMVTYWKQVKWEGRHFAIWQDPTKSRYLFACVIGDLGGTERSYTTSEGRDVALGNLCNR